MAGYSIQTEQQVKICFDLLLNSKSWSETIKKITPAGNPSTSCTYQTHSLYTLRLLEHFCDSQKGRSLKKCLVLKVVVCFVQMKLVGTWLTWVRCYCRRNADPARQRDPPCEENPDYYWTCFGLVYWLIYLKADYSGAKKLQLLSRVG